MPAVDWMWTGSVVALRALRTPEGTEHMIVTGYDGPAGKRTRCIWHLLERPDLAWIYFCDSDMTPEPDAILKLLALDVPVAGALYTTRIPPFHYEVQALDGRVRTDGPFEVRWTGGGALLVRREVIESIAPPYFEYQDGTDINEDHFFCGKVRAAGYPIIIEPRVRVGHVAAIPITPWLLERLGGRELPGLPVGPGLEVEREGAVIAR